MTPTADTRERSRRASPARRFRGHASASTVALIAVKLAVSAWAVHVGFTHVSDDDYARVTIAQSFAHTPTLDPSGTSWLPFPFWLNGLIMMVLGRSLRVAQGVALVSSVAGAVLVYAAARRLGVKGWVAWCGVALAMSAPWSVWLGVATVPEALTASLVVVGALSLEDPSAQLAGASALLAASLSRYEAWPVAFVFAVACALRVLSRDRAVSARRRRKDAVACVLALAGPGFWMVWNAHAHGDPLHFLARVAAYRVRVLPAAGASTLTLYPEAFVRAAPLTLALAALGAPGLGLDRELRRRWAWPLGAMAAMVVFLVAGDLGNGAPTHHPERALVAVFWTGCLFGVDGVRSIAVRLVWARPKREWWLVALVVGVLVAWGSSWPQRIDDYPAKSGDEDRARELEAGQDLRDRRVRHVTVTPCAYEHFALIASFGAPERVTILAAPQSPSVPSPATGVSTRSAGECPVIDEP